MFLRYKDVLFTLCLKYCKSTTEAEDHLQDSFIKIFQNIKRYANKGSFEGWMKRIVAPSRFLKDIVEGYGVPPERTELIHNAYHGPATVEEDQAAARAALDTAEANMRLARSGHFPTLDLVAGYSQFTNKKYVYRDFINGIDGGAVSR